MSVPEGTQGGPTTIGSSKRQSPLIHCQNIHEQCTSQEELKPTWKKVIAKANRLTYEEQKLISRYKRFSEIQSIPISPRHKELSVELKPTRREVDNGGLAKSSVRQNLYMKDSDSDTFNAIKMAVGISDIRYENIHKCYSDVQLNVKVSLVLSVLGIMCGFICNELETNWWFLDQNELAEGSHEIYYHKVLLVDKIAGILIAMFLVVINIRYHVLMLICEVSSQGNRNKSLVILTAQESPKIWDIPETRCRVICETMAILIVQLPGFNGRLSVKGFPCGLSHLDPEGRYFYDTFIFLVLFTVRCCFLARFIHVKQDLFSLEGEYMANFSQTKPSLSLAVRTLLSRHQVISSITVTLTYLVVVAYVHRTVEGSVVNVWPEDRRCDPMASLCVQIWAGEHPVTYLNSLWLHFAAASTIGFGEYTAHTHFGRLFIAASYYIGLCLNSFIVFVMFNVLPLSKMERTVVGRVYRRHVNMGLRQNAAILIQSFIRSKRAAQNNVRGPKLYGEHKGKLCTRKISKVSPVGGQISALGRQQSFSAIFRKYMKHFNVSLLRWRRARSRAERLLDESAPYDVETAGALMVIKARQIKAEVERALLKLDQRVSRGD